MKLFSNPYRGIGLDHPALAEMPMPSTDADAPRHLLARCPEAFETPLRASPELAAQAGVKSVWVKDERARMGLGSFKALGAAYVIAMMAAAGTAQGRCFVTSSAGNHGLSVAMGAKLFGAKSAIYLSASVPEGFAQRLRELGAEVVRAGETYEQSMAAAMARADAQGDVLLSDTSFPGYSEPPFRIMEGYLVLMAEVIDAMDSAPDHIFLQAGVGGLAGSAAALARSVWGDAPKIWVVEPNAAPCLQASIEAGAPVAVEGPVSDMGRLDCKEPSLIALKGLARDADVFASISEVEAEAGASFCAAHGMASSTSGTAGISALLHATGLSPDDTALCILSEGPA